MCLLIVAEVGTYRICWCGVPSEVNSQQACPVQLGRVNVLDDQTMAPNTNGVLDRTGAQLDANGNVIGDIGIDWTQLRNPVSASKRLVVPSLRYTEIAI
jgi:hypothetical protein